MGETALKQTFGCRFPDQQGFRLVGLDIPAAPGGMVQSDCEPFMSAAIVRWMVNNATHQYQAF